MRYLPPFNFICLQEKARALAEPVGPLGSSKKKDIASTPEVSLLVNRPASELAELWKRGNLYGRANSLDSQVHPYVPSSSVRSKLNNVLLPGEKCGSCKKNRVMFLFSRECSYLVNHRKVARAA